MKKRFLTPLNLACGKTKIVDQFHYIYFKDGHIYVSNGIVSIKQRMELHGFSAPAIKLLDGMCMHKDVFSLINKYEVHFHGHFYLEEILKKEFPVVDVIFKIGATPFTCIMKNFNDVPGNGMLVQYIDEIFETFTMREHKEVALDPDTITMIRKVFVTECSGFTFRFNRGKGGVLVTPNRDKYQENAIIKPLLLTGKLNKK